MYSYFLNEIVYLFDRLKQLKKQQESDVFNRTVSNYLLLVSMRRYAANYGRAVPIFYCSKYLCYSLSSGYTSNNRSRSDCLKNTARFVPRWYFVTSLLRRIAQACCVKFLETHMPLLRLNPPRLLDISACLAGGFPITFVSRAPASRKLCIQYSSRSNVSFVQSETET